jgi:diguanylate cyclase (GGDEF)-like protein
MIKTTQHLCPCCSEPLLRHVSCQRVYWFCRQCHQEMPDIENLLTTQLVPEHWASKSSIPKEVPTKLLSERRYFCLEDQKVAQRLAFSDRLTKIANRLRFQAYLDQQWRGMAQSKMSLSLILGDIDFFTAYNDLYGHQAGDRCLLKVAQAIASIVEDSSDLVPDSGGEEFVVILPRTKAAGAHRVAQEILAEVRRLKIPHFHSEISPYLTLSLGVASIIPSEEYSADLLLNSADQALYQAKNRGRDRLILHENLLKHITITEPKTIVPASCADKSDRLMGYVAYYLSRGKSIISPHHGSIPFKNSIYQYSGYQEPFEAFWQQIRERNDFSDLHIDGDFYSFGQLLDGSCTIGECARCNLPTPLSVGRAPDLSNCTLCIEPLTASEFDDVSLLNDRQKVIAIGPLPADAQNLQELFFRNGIEVTFVETPEDLLRQMPSKVDLVMLLGDISEATGKIWAEELSHYRQFSAVPIVALSLDAGHGLPWMERNLGLVDYLLTPHNGDLLAAHLRQMTQPQLQIGTTEPHWFPR